MKIFWHQFWIFLYHHGNSPTRITNQIENCNKWKDSSDRVCENHGLNPQKTQWQFVNLDNQLLVHFLNLTKSYTNLKEKMGHENVKQRTFLNRISLFLKHINIMLRTALRPSVSWTSIVMMRGFNTLVLKLWTDSVTT
jgi:hypothetical protein